VVVTPETVAVQGWGLYEHVGQKVEELLAEKVGEAAVVHVTFNAEAAAAAESAARPRPEICAEQIGAILDAGQIQFGAGSADIVPQSRGVIAAIADVLRGCPGADFEIGGHTDSQGTAEANQGLSERRAQAVLAALQAQDLPMVRLTARGFGAGDPVGDNASVAGRASNRRIEFTLLDAEEVAARAAAETEAMTEAVPECADAVGAILGDGSIQFDAGSATITPESDAVIEAIAGTLRGCPETAFEIAGHTDSQGSESGNLRLSQDRAEAVLAALRALGLPLAGSVAQGYGEAEPVAGNDTAEGRAQNRRIAFAPIEPEEAVAEGDGPAAEGTATACLQAVDAVLAKGSVQFSAGSETLAPESGAVLDAIAEALRGCPDVAMEIGGYTDSEGAESWNQQLSQKRATAA
jgi:outer membrane protein OmpA-like peptidoglycan-associated protein